MLKDFILETGAPSPPPAHAPTCYKEAVRTRLGLGDKQAFEALPPLLLDPSPLPSSQILYACDRPSKYGAAASLLPSDHGSDEFIGAFLMDICARPRAALCWLTDAAVLKIHVYDCPLAAMEAELYAEAEAPTKLEEAFLGDGLATANVGVRASIGAHLRAAALDEVPKCLIGNDSYAIEREGVLPALHLRPPRTNQEKTLLERAIAAFAPDDAPMIDARIDALLASEALKEVNFVTVFAKTPVPPNSSAGAGPAKNQCPAALAVVAAAVLGAAPTSLKMAVASLATKPLESTVVKPQANTLSSLTAMIGTLTEVRFYGTSLVSLASNVFVEQDIGLAVVDIDFSKENAQSSTSEIWAALNKCAHRVDAATGAVLLLSFGSGQELKRSKLCNDKLDVDVDLDAAVRLAQMEGIHAIGHMEADEGSGRFFVLTVKGVDRSPLCVTNEVRSTYVVDDGHLLDQMRAMIEDKMRDMPTAAPQPFSSLYSATPYTSPQLEGLKRALQLPVA